MTLFLGQQVDGHSLPLARNPHPDTMAERRRRSRLAGGNAWRAGCVETRTSGSAGGPGKRAGETPEPRPGPTQHPFPEGGDGGADRAGPGLP